MFPLVGRQAAPGFDVAAGAKESSVAFEDDCADGEIGADGGDVRLELVEHGEGERVALLGTIERDLGPRDAVALLAGIEDFGFPCLRSFLRVMQLKNGAL